MVFPSLPNCTPEVFVHARRHVFVVRMRDDQPASSARMVLVITDHPACCGKSRPVAGSGESDGHWHSAWRRLCGCSSLSPADVSATPEAGSGVLLGGDEDIVRGSGGRREVAPHTRGGERGLYRRRAGSPP